MGEGDTDWERAHLRVERNGVEYGDTDWERAHLIWLEWFGGGSHRLGDSALESGRERVEERNSNWERAHLRVERNGVVERDTDWERAHLIGWE